MKTESSYNGWKNYETWNVALWLDNDQGSYNYWRGVAQECYDDAEAEKHLTRKENAACDLADRLKNEIEESMPDLGASMFADLLGAAMSEVNWREIAENWLDDVEEDEEEGEDQDE